MNWQPIETAPKDGTHALVLPANKMKFDEWWDANHESHDCCQVLRGFAQQVWEAAISSLPPTGMAVTDRSGEVCNNCGSLQVTTEKGCVCDPFEWRNPDNIPAVCGQFSPSSWDEDQCSTCEHSKACHQNPEGEASS